MKAGVFRNGYVLIYVTSDQRITAHTNLRLLIDSHPVAGFKVRYSKAGDTVSHDGLTFSRVEGDFGYKAEAAVAAARRKVKQVSLDTPPNGKCPTHVWLDELQHNADAKPLPSTSNLPWLLQHNADAKPVGQVVDVKENHVTFMMHKMVGMSVTRVAAATLRKSIADTAARNGLRTCRKQSARKHRKQGHTVAKISNNLYIWSK